MKTELTARAAGVARYNIFASPVGPRILLDAPNDNGSGDDEAAKAAADKAAADKAEADRLAAEKAEKEAREKEKGSSLSDTEHKLLREVMEKKDELTKAKEALKAFDGIDPAEFKRLKDAADKAEAEKRDAEKKAAEAAGDTKRLMEMMADEHKKEIEKVLTDAKSAQDALAAAQATINELTIGSAFSQSSFVTEELVVPASKARKLFGDHFEVEDGRPVAYDKPKGAAERTKLIDGSGKPMPFEAALKKLVEADPDRDQLVKSGMKNGAGSKTADTKATEKEPDVFGVNRITAALNAKKNQ